MYYKHIRTKTRELKDNTGTAFLPKINLTLCYLNVSIKYWALLKKFTLEKPYVP